MKNSQPESQSVSLSSMQGMTLEKIVSACGGVYYGPEQKKKSHVSNITADSRQIDKDCLFVAIKGAHVDGNDFVEASYEGGALCCLSEKTPSKTEYPYIVVDSCYQALKDMAKLYRSQMRLPVIGITGSVGKTSTKEMVASVLSEHFCVLKTQGNFNNEVGVPYTLFRLRKEHEIAVVEMGISDFGEMERLSGIVRPDICMITNIGQCHLENLHDLDGVLRAKTEIFSGMNPEGTIYLNGDDDKLAAVQVDGKKKITCFGIENTSGAYAKDIRNLGLHGTEAVFFVNGETFGVTVPVPGQHMVLNALAAAAVAKDLGMTAEEIRSGIAKFKPVGGHGSMAKTDLFTILDDCYNANPVSMKAAIDVLSGVLGRKVAIVGDMFELGAEEEELHAEVGAYAVQKQIDLLVCIGNLTRHCYTGALQKKDIPNVTRTVYFADKEEAMEKLPGLLEKGDTVLVKASHGMHFEKIVAVLKEM